MATRAVAAGNLDERVPVGSRDEIGQLSRTFNDMIAQLQAAHQMQTDFVANVSHEARTPLASIKGMLETLLDGAVDDPQTRDRFLHSMEGETDRLIRLVNDLLLLSRFDSQGLELHKEPVPVDTLIQKTIEQLTPRIEAKGLKLQKDLPAGQTKVHADADRMRQVMLNLLDNAIKYSHQGGLITVKASAESNGTVAIRVIDEGIGIPSESLSRIGQRFFRTDKARSREEGGTGLGLAIAIAIIEAHGGKLTIESAEGKGTAVTFTLPIG